MRLVHVRVYRIDFGKILSAMREWLDRNYCRVGRFETEGSDDGSIVVKAQFNDDLLAEQFRREFQGNYGD